MDALFHVFPRKSDQFIHFDLVIRQRPHAFVVQNKPICANRIVEIRLDFSEAGRGLNIGGVVYQLVRGESVRPEEFAHLADVEP